MNKVRRIYVEKKPAYSIKAKELQSEMLNYLNIQADNVRVLIRYDIENLSDETFQNALTTVFSEPPVDDVYLEEFPHGADDFCFTVEYLPGQFDQRADSAEQCVCLLNDAEQPIIKSATTYVISGKLTEEQRQAVVKHCVNPVDSRVTDEPKPDTLKDHFDEPADVIVFSGFANMAEDKLRELYDSLGLAMTFADFKHIQRYFHDEEHRDPTMTEIRVLDTYWSDHCRHTTFATELKDVQFDDGFYRPLIEGAFRQYLADHKEQYAGRTDKYVCLMDIGTLAAKRLKKAGYLDDQEPSDEINACSIVVPVTIDHEDGTSTDEEWLVNFKNGSEASATKLECIENGALKTFLTEWKAMYDAGALVNQSLSTNQFIAGEVAIFTNSSANVRNILSKVNGAFEVGTSTYLRVNDGASYGATVSGSCLVMFDSQNSLKKAATWEFIKYMTGEGVQVDFAIGTGYTPAYKSASDNAAYKEFLAATPQFAVAADQLAKTPASMRSITIGPSVDFYYAIQNEVSDMLSKNLAVDAVVKSMGDNLQALLDNYHRTNP